MTLRIVIGSAAHLSRLKGAFDEDSLKPRLEVICWMAFWVPAGPCMSLFGGM